MNEFTTYLMHHGVQGMHWGIRRYQDYGHGGYDPDHEGKFVGKTSNKDRKAVYRALKTNKQIGKVLENKALRKAYESNEKLRKVSKKSTKEKREYIHRENEKYDSLANKEYLEYYRSKHKMAKEYRKFAEDFLGKYADKKVGSLGDGRIGKQSAKDILANMLIQYGQTMYT